jgi:hypothetical protein
MRESVARKYGSSRVRIHAAALPRIRSRAYTRLSPATVLPLVPPGHPVRLGIAAEYADENRPLETRPTRFLQWKSRKLEMPTETRNCLSGDSAKKTLKINSPEEPAIYPSHQSPLASASPSHTDRKFSYHVFVKLVMTCSAVCPAIFTPEWTMSPQVCTRVPFPGCSSKPTHCARTTPSEWSIHPTLCAGWQFVITWLTTVLTGSRISISSRLPASHGRPSRQFISP